MAKDKQNIAQEICMFAHFAIDFVLFFLFSASIARYFVFARSFSVRKWQQWEKEKSENPYAKPSLTEFEFQLKLNKQTFGCAGTRSAKTEG